MFQLDTRSMLLKLADFGLSRKFSKDLLGKGPKSVFHARWTAPELWDQLQEDDIGYASNDHSSEGE
mgnify:CR=1 FL=1